MAGTEVTFKDQVGPCAHTTLPLVGWEEGLPGLVNPWVANKVVESGGEEKDGRRDLPHLNNVCEELGVQL